jgi:polysaccharide export outer membrane protein
MSDMTLLEAYHGAATRSLQARRPRKRASWMLVACALAPLGLALPAHGVELWPQTKVRLTVVQWEPLEGQYERWEAFSGELIVSEDGTLPIPVIGAVPVQERTAAQVASEVAGALQAKLGLVTPPDTSIEIIEFPPVYVVGVVATPGAFPFRPGMTVLQAFALGGGMRAETTETSADRLRLAAELRSATDGLVRSNGRIARLQAEIAGAAEISFPDVVTTHANAELVREVVTQETAIFAARKKELARQETALTELGHLLRAEIETIEERIKDVDTAIASTETELKGVQSLVAQGLATVSRRSELEREMADYRFERLSQTTAILRAQQALNAASREAARLGDVRHTETAQGLQTEQAMVERLLLQQATTERLLLNLDTTFSPTAAAQLEYVVVRQGSSGPQQLAVDESAAMVPGDVLKVSVAITQRAGTTAAAADAAAVGATADLAR